MNKKIIITTIFILIVTMLCGCTLQTNNINEITELEFTKDFNESTNYTQKINESQINNELYNKIEFIDYVYERTNTNFIEYRKQNKTYDEAMESILISLTYLKEMQKELTYNTSYKKAVLQQNKTLFLKMYHLNNYIYIYYQGVFYLQQSMYTFEIEHNENKAQEYLELYYKSIEEMNKDGNLYNNVVLNT